MSLKPSSKQQGTEHWIDAGQQQEYLPNQRTPESSQCLSHAQNKRIHVKVKRILSLSSIDLKKNLSNLTKFFLKFSNLQLKYRGIKIKLCGFLKVKQLVLKRIARFHLVTADVNHLCLLIQIFRVIHSNKACGAYLPFK